MHQGVASTIVFVSTVTRLGCALGVIACASAVSACGWKAGPHRGVALSVGPVDGSTVEPGLRAALRQELTRALRDRGVQPGGRTVQLTLTDVGHGPSAAVGDVVAWTGHVVAEVRIPSRPSCALTVEGRRTWTLGPGSPADASARRAEAITVLAREAGERAADALLGDPLCR